MKISVVSVFLISVALYSGVVLAVDSSATTNTSGAADNTLMTQTHDPKADSHKASSQINKGGRPITNSDSTPGK
jgi:hypothetical protein